MKKKILAVILSAAMTAGISSISVLAADDSYNVGICQLVSMRLLMRLLRALRMLFRKLNSSNISIDKYPEDGEYLCYHSGLVSKRLN